MAGAKGPRAKRGGGKKRIEVCSNEKSQDKSISEESNSKDVDFVPYRACTRFNRSPVKIVIKKKTSRLSPILVQKQNQRTKLSKKGKNATPERCTSKQPPEEGNRDSVLDLHEVPISVMPREDDPIPNAPVTSSLSGTPIVETTVTAGSLDKSSAAMDEQAAPIPMVISPSHQNHVDVQGPTNVIGNGLDSGCLSRANNSSTSINVTELAKRLHENNDHEEAQSAPDPGLEDVWGHKVKPELAPLLRRIFDKHGDIARQTDLKSPNILSNFLQQLCRICEQLERTNFFQIKRAEMNSMLDDISDFERVKLDVGWLRERLEHVFRAWNGYQQYCGLKEEIGNYDVSIEGLEKELEDWKKKVSDVEGELEAKRAESGQMRALVADTKARVKTLGKQNLADGLFSKGTLRRSFFVAVI